MDANKITARIEKNRTPAKKEKFIVDLDSSTETKLEEILKHYNAKKTHWFKAVVDELHHEIFIKE